MSFFEPPVTWVKAQPKLHRILIGFCSGQVMYIGKERMLTFGLPVFLWVTQILDHTGHSAPENNQKLKLSWTFFNNLSSQTKTETNYKATCIRFIPFLTCRCQRPQRPLRLWPPPQVWRKKGVPEALGPGRHVGFTMRSFPKAQTAP